MRSRITGSTIPMKYPTRIFGTCAGGLLDQTANDSASRRAAGLRGNRYFFGLVSLERLTASVVVLAAAHATKPCDNPPAPRQSPRNLKHQPNRVVLGPCDAFRRQAVHKPVTRAPYQQRAPYFLSPAWRFPRCPNYSL
jgi:hypothetical protein